MQGVLWSAGMDAHHQTSIRPNKTWGGGSYLPYNMDRKSSDIFDLIVECVLRSFTC